MQAQAPLVLKGKLVNYPSSYLRIFKKDLFTTKFDSVLVNKDGTFNTTLNCEGQIELGLLLNDKPYFMYGSADDVISINYNAGTRKFIKVAAQTPQKTHRLIYDLTTIIKADMARDSVFRNIIAKAPNDSAKYKLAAWYYNNELNGLLTRKILLGPELDRYINELYFAYANLLSAYQLNSYEKLVDDAESDNKLKTYNTTSIERLANGPSTAKTDDNAIIPKRLHYKTLSKNILLKSPEYRSFFFNNTRFAPGPNDNKRAELLSKYGDVKKSAPWGEYYLAAGIKDNYVREWYTTNSILLDLGAYDIGETQKVMNDFLPKSKNPYFKKIIDSSWVNVVKFKKGADAPTFSLPDQTGKRISLSDLKGKVVFIDFWGVHCGACIADINADAKSLHLKYKNKNVVFLNICVNENKASWLAALKRLKLDGINLIAPGWVDNPVCKLYNINAIPHYVIIDKQGKIFDYNANELGKYLLALKYNGLDEALKL